MGCAQQLDSLLEASEISLQRTRTDMLVVTHKASAPVSQITREAQLPAQPLSLPASLATLVPKQHHLRDFLVDSGYFKYDPLLVKGDVRVGVARCIYVSYSDSRQNHASGVGAGSMKLDHCQFPQLMTSLFGKVGVKPVSRA